jgi:hypothetical protein
VCVYVRVCVCVCTRARVCVCVCAIAAREVQMHTGMRMFTYKDTHLRVYPYGLQHGSPVLPRRTRSWEPMPRPPTLAVHLHVCMRARVCACVRVCVCVCVRCAL